MKRKFFSKNKTFAPKKQQLEVTYEHDPKIQEEKRRLEQMYRNVKWTEEQQNTINAIDNGDNVFLTAPGGAGKSFLLRYLIHRARNELGLKVAVTASTGIAAVPLGGTTIHSALGVGMAKQTADELVSLKAKDKKFVEEWLGYDLLIIDEISMVEPEFLDKIDKILRKVRAQPHKPFGGIQVLLVGDFAQLPPVKDKDSTYPFDFVFELPLWAELKLHIMELKKVFRQDNIAMISALNRMRMGQCLPEDEALFRTCVGRKFNVSDGIQPTVLYSYNKNVDEMNKAQLDKLPGKEYVYNSRTGQVLSEGMSIDDPIFRHVQKTLDAIQYQMVNNGPAVKIISLKVGAQVLLTANLSFENGLVNGSRGVVVDFEKEDPDDPASQAYPVVKFTNGAKVTLKPHRWSVKEQISNSEVYLMQVPLKLAWSITIHAYVALSRASSLEGLSLEVFDSKVIKANPKVVKFYRDGCKYQGKPVQIQTTLFGALQGHASALQGHASKTTPASVDDSYLDSESEDDNDTDDTEDDVDEDDDEEEEEPMPTPKRTRKL